jgi:hypothetical protein
MNKRRHRRQSLVADESDFAENASGNDRHHLGAAA